MDLKGWFRGSVLEEVLIPYTLPGFPLVVLMTVLLPPDTAWRLFTDGNPTTPFVALILAWGLSIVFSAAESALGRLIHDRLPDSLKRRLAGVGKTRHDQTIAAIGLDKPDKKHERYELVRSRFYLWGEFNKGMTFTVAITAAFLPVITERYFPWIALPAWGIAGVYVVLFTLTAAHLVNWQRDLWRWELFEGVRDE